MTEVEVLRLYRMGDEVSYRDGEGLRKRGLCVGWGQSPVNKERYMLIETESGNHEKRVALTNIVPVVRPFSLSRIRT